MEGCMDIAIEDGACGSSGLLKCDKSIKTSIHKMQSRPRAAVLYVCMYFSQPMLSFRIALCTCEMHRFKLCLRIRVLPSLEGKPCKVVVDESKEAPS